MSVTWYIIQTIVSLTGLSLCIYLMVAPRLRIKKGKKQKEETQKNLGENIQQNRRSITVNRWSHAHKNMTLSGINNIVNDAEKYGVFLDDIYVDELNTNQPVTAYMDEQEHKLEIARIQKRSCKIPAGNESYYAVIFNEKLAIVPVEDTFREELIKFVVVMFKGQGIKDRINDPNNRYHSIDISCNNQEIYLTRALNSTKGGSISQKLTGNAEERIPYEQIGLTPSPKYTELTDYWYLTTKLVKEAIKQDEEIGMEDGTGGLVYRKTHKLY